MANVCFWQIVLRNSQNDVRPISRKWTKEAAIADRSGFQPVTEVACKSAQECSPQMISRSPRVRSGKFVFSDAKKLLQQYLPIGDIAPKLRGFKKRCPKAGSFRPRQFQCPARSDECASESWQRVMLLPALRVASISRFQAAQPHSERHRRSELSSERCSCCRRARP